MDSEEKATRQIQSVFRAISFVENNLQNNIDIEMMAQEACYSLFHFIRIFTNTTGLGPYDYLMRRRIAESAHYIVSTNKTIIQISLEYRFEVIDTYTRAFKRCLGVNPSKARTNKKFLKQNSLKPFSLEYLKWFIRASPSEVKPIHEILYYCESKEKNTLIRDYISKHIFEIYLPIKGCFNHEDNMPYYLEFQYDKEKLISVWIKEK